jgi:hypothetical protein
METIKENEILSNDEKLKRIKEAKGGTWYDGWKPYCLVCSTMSRMVEQTYGFKCNHCGNVIGFNLTRLMESPLNNK